MDKIPPTQLGAYLNKKSASVYCITGADILLQNETQDALVSHAAKQGFNDKFSFHIEPKSDWQTIIEASQSMGLFSTKTLLILHFSDVALSSDIHAKLDELTHYLHDDLCCIFILPKWQKSIENTKWFKKIDAKTVLIQCNTPDIAALPNWIKQRAKTAQIDIDDESIQLLSYYYEGNLLALSQILQLLQLLYPQTTITLPRLEDVIYDAAQFTPYHWLDTLLKGQKKRAWHILQQLKREGIEPIILLRILQKELILLLSLQEQSRLIPLKSVFDQYRVWQNRRTLLTGALTRLSPSRLRCFLTQLTELDTQFRKQSENVIWQGLEALSLHFCDANSAPFSVIK